jgi:hypothetical protein
MRFLVMVKANEETESGAMPSADELAAMGRYNEELIKAGVLLAGEGLRESALGAIVKFTDGTPTVIDGPFTEAKELVAGFWLLDVRSREEAIEWVKRVPCADGVPASIEIRQVFEANDLIAAAERGEQLL